MNAKTTVYILTRNRVALLRKALISVLSQDVPVHVRISDNSLGSETQDMLGREFPSVDCVRRTPPLNALEHFRVVLSEVETEFFMLFHDDDVMLSHCVRQLQSTLQANPELVAVAGDAGRLSGNRLIPGTLMGAIKAPLRLGRPTDLLAYYFAKNLISPAPFPGYMYRRTATRDLALESEQGGKYADVSFLLKLNERGAVLWVPDVLMHYRYHSHNDSGIPAMSDALSLIRFVRDRYALNHQNPLIMEYRLRCWAQWLLFIRRHSEIGKRWPRRRAVVKRAVLLGALGLILSSPRLWCVAWARLKLTLTGMFKA